MYLIDTNIAIYLRDVDREIAARVEELSMIPKLSLVSWIELEGGVYIDPSNVGQRRINLDTLLDLLEILSVDDAVVRAYGRIVETRGFSRTRVLDRLIAATAIVNDLTLITINGPDFRDIPGLKLEIWPAPQ